MGDEDAKHYAEYVGIELGIDGNQCFARRNDFEDLQQSDCGFGDTYLDAMADLCKQQGFKGGKMWQTTFKDLVTS